MRCVCVKGRGYHVHGSWMDNNDHSFNAIFSSITQERSVL